MIAWNQLTPVLAAHDQTIRADLVLLAAAVDQQAHLTAVAAIDRILIAAHTLKLWLTDNGRAIPDNLK